MRQREEVHRLLSEILAKVSAPLAWAEYRFESTLATRFGENAITQNNIGETETFRVDAAYGTRHGSSVTNRTDAEALTELVRRAQTIAAASPEDPEFMPPVGPRTYPAVPRRFYEDVAAITPDDAADRIREAVSFSDDLAYEASGLMTAQCGIVAKADTLGMFAFDQVSGVEFSTTVHGPRGSGYAYGSAETAKTFDTAGIARIAVETARAAQDPADITPGDYTVIFEPQAVLDFLLFLFWNMSARDADEGTSVFAGNVGKKLFSEKVTLSTPIDDPEVPAAPFGEDGLPSRPGVWIRDGVVERLFHDRYWAKTRNVEPDPIAHPFVMAGEDRSVDDLVAGCRRGLLVKRLWYIRYVDRKELLLTGMTRDGVFLVDNGKIRGPVKNLRFNESPVVFLQNVVGMSRPVRVDSWAKLPAVVSDGFTFSSGTDSV